MNWTYLKHCTVTAQFIIDVKRWQALTLYLVEMFQEKKPAARGSYDKSFRSAAKPGLQIFVQIQTLT